MKVQRVRLANDSVTWIVLDDDHTPVQPLLSYLKYLHTLDRSPHTVRATAHRLKLFWEYLRDEQLCWKGGMSLSLQPSFPGCAGSIRWSSRLHHVFAHRTNATIDLALGALYGFYSYHTRLGTLPEIPLYQLTLPHRGRYQPFLHGIAQAKPEATRVVKLKREQRPPKTLTSELLDAYIHKQDRFLLALMYETGMRVGQCLSLAHADLSVEGRTLLIVPRPDHPNGARAKTRTIYTIPLPEQLLHLYTEYLVDELCALEVESSQILSLSICGRAKLVAPRVLRSREIAGKTAYQENGDPLYASYASPHAGYFLDQRRQTGLTRRLPITDTCQYSDHQ